MFVVVRVHSGILEGVTLFEDREQALRFGREQFEEASIGVVEDYAETDDPDYDSEWGGVSRGFVMAWQTDDVDVWVTEPLSNTKRNEQHRLLLTQCPDLPDDFYWANKDAVEAFEASFRKWKASVRTELGIELEEGTCEHKSHEDCMNCTVCGQCREDLDSTDTCMDCGGREEDG